MQQRIVENSSFVSVFPLGNGLRVVEQYELQPKLLLLDHGGTFLRQFGSSLACPVVVGTYNEYVALRISCIESDEILLFHVTDHDDVLVTRIAIPRRTISLGVIGNRNAKPSVVTYLDNCLYFSEGDAFDANFVIPQLFHVAHAGIVFDAEVFITGENEYGAPFLERYGLGGVKFGRLALPAGCVQTVPTADQQFVGAFASNGGHIDAILIIDSAGKILRKTEIAPAWLIGSRVVNGLATFVLSRKARRIHLLVGSDMCIQTTNFAPLEVLSTRVLVASNDMPLQGEAREEVFEKPDGTNLHVVSRHPEIANGVVVISLHGGPYAASLLDMHSQLSSAILEDGSMVLEPNLAGSVGYGDDHLIALDIEYLRQGIISDIHFLVNKMRRRGTKKIILMGESFGAYLAAKAGLVLGSSIISGIVLINGFFDPQSEVELDPQTEILMRRFFSRSEPDGGLPSSGSLIPLINLNSASILIIYSERDDRVAPSQSLEFHQKALMAGVSTSVVMVREATHKDWGVDGITKRNQAIVAFIRAVSVEQ